MSDNYLKHKRDTDDRSGYVVVEDSNRVSIFSYLSRRASNIIVRVRGTLTFARGTVGGMLQFRKKSDTTRYPSGTNLGIINMSQSFSFRNSTSEVANLNNSGNLQIDGNLTVSGETPASVGWHGSVTRIKILPRDFQPDDGGRPAMIEDDTSDERFLHSHGSGKLYASIAIPTGFKATHVMIYGSDTGQTHTTYEANIANKDVVEKGAATAIETEKAITNVTSSTTNYLLIEVTSDGATDEIHGGYVTIGVA